MEEKKVIETTLTEYENEQLKLLKSVFDMGCAFKMLALQKEANDWKLKYLNEKKDLEYAEEQIGRFIVKVDWLKKELAKKESDTAREVLQMVAENYKGYESDMDNLILALHERFGVHLGE